MMICQFSFDLAMVSLNKGSVLTIYIELLNKMESYKHGVVPLPAKFPTLPAWPFFGIAWGHNLKIII